MLIKVRDLLGIGPIPNDRTAAGVWILRNGIETIAMKLRGGNAAAVHLSDLPATVRRAVLEREAERAGLEPGVYDEEAHEELMGATPGMRAKAERLSEIARFVLARRNAGLSRAEVFAAVRAQFGADCTSDASLDRLSRRVDGVDPVNFAPALLDGYSRAGAPKVNIPPEAWAVFEGIVKASFKTHRMTAIYNDAAAASAKNGQVWPSYSTVNRRFHDLPLAEQLALREGRDAAHKALYQAQLRDSSGLRAMEWVSQDGRRVDVFVRFPDGSVLRPTIHALTDQASGKVLGHEFDRSENSQATARLQRRVFGLYGAPDNLKTDNSSAFAGHAQAGQVPFKFRNRGNRRRDMEPPGVFKLLGFKLHFAAVKNGQEKRVERSFADLSREIDTCPEFMGAHAGSHPGERPEADIVPVEWEIFKDVYARRIAAYNDRKGRRSQGCKATRTGSYNKAFVAMSEGRARRTISEAQLRLVTMEWTLKAVQPDGRVCGKDGWLYGEDMDDESQDKLLRLKGNQVWTGTDPLDRSKPALVWNPKTDRIIMDGVHAVVRGAFDDAEGARRSARRKSHVRTLTKRVEKIDAEAAIAALGGIYSDLVENDLPSAPVVAPNFKQPIRRAEDEGEGGILSLPKRKSFITPEMRENKRRAAFGGRDG